MSAIWSMGDPPLVSHPVIVIGIPAYNEERFLARAIASLKAQTWTDFAVLIADNASSDATSAIALGAIAGDSRFTYRRQQSNIGGSGNFNFLRSASQSPLFMWLGAHDAIAPEFLAKTIPPMMSNPNLSVAYTHTGWTDDTGMMTHVTTSPGMERLPNNPLVRFVLTTRRIEWCTEINNVLRRSALEGYEFQNVFGTDLIGLAHLAFKGLYYCVPEPLYLRWRRAEDQDVYYMERLTGQTGKGWDLEAFVDAAEDRLISLAGRNTLSRLARIALRGQLEHRFDIPNKGNTAKLFGRAAWIKSMFPILRRHQ